MSYFKPYDLRGPRKKSGKIRSKGLYCRWLPDADEDIRPDKLKYTGGTSKGKRKYFEGTTGEEDPYLAGYEAVKWYKEQRNLLTEMMKELEYNSNHSLEHYWELYFTDFTNEYRDKVGGRKRSRTREALGLLKRQVSESNHLQGRY